jgi:hypothetical protein
VLAAVSVLALAGCTTWQPQDPSLDGWPLGEKGTCEPAAADDPASDVVAIAESGLGAAHLPVASIGCYSEGAYLRYGRPFLPVHSGGTVIVVFGFADGTRHAVGVHCLVECAVAEPERDPAPLFAPLLVALGLGIALLFFWSARHGPPHGGQAPPRADDSWLALQ